LNQRVTVGRIGRAHGLAGELYVISESDAEERFRSGATFQTDEQPPRLLEVLKSRRHQGRLLVVFSEVTSRTAAECLRDVGLTIAIDERRGLDEDEYWPDQLVGLTVRDPGGHTLGIVIAVETNGAQDRLVVRTTAGHEALVPFVSELVPEVRMAEGLVIVSPIEGLFSPSPD